MKSRPILSRLAVHVRMSARCPRFRTDRQRERAHGERLDALRVARRGERLAYPLRLRGERRLFARKRKRIGADVGRIDVRAALGVRSMDDVSQDRPELQGRAPRRSHFSVLRSPTPIIGLLGAALHSDAVVFGAALGPGLTSAPGVSPRVVLRSRGNPTSLVQERRPPTPEAAHRLWRLRRRRRPAEPRPFRFPSRYRRRSLRRRVRSLRRRTSKDRTKRRTALPRRRCGLRRRAFAEAWPTSPRVRARPSNGAQEPGAQRAHERRPRERVRTPPEDGSSKPISETARPAQAEEGAVARVPIARRRRSAARVSPETDGPAEQALRVGVDEQLLSERDAFWVAVKERNRDGRIDAGVGTSETTTVDVPRGSFAWARRRSRLCRRRRTERICKCRQLRKTTTACGRVPDRGRQRSAE